MSARRLEVSPTLFWRHVPAGKSPPWTDNPNPQIYFLDQHVWCQLSHLFLMERKPRSLVRLQGCSVQAFPRKYLQVELDMYRNYEQQNTDEKTRRYEQRNTDEDTYQGD